ncbi:MAG: AMP-binding protein, partial [Sneathiella sp.]|nr:AMP-binding protein [Sneathiella sp.]
MVQKFTTIGDLLSHGGDTHQALSAPSRPSLSFASLRHLVSETTDWLNDFGIGRNDPVAIVLPNGPEMASAFVAIASAATS